MVTTGHARFNAVHGMHEAFILNNNIRLKMIDVSGFKKIGDNYFIQTGSPHHVGFYSDIKKIDVFKEGKFIRNSEIYKPDGSNVNFVEYKEGTVYIRTYERGVEDETLSCGTGSVAAAIAVAHKYDSSENVYSLNAPGGQLKVSFEKSSDGTFRNIWLEGPATFVFSGKIKI